MDAICHSKILHNNLSEDNIILHFPLNKLDVVYISMCDLGEVGCLQKLMSSLYGFAKEQNATNTKEVRWWVALKFSFVYSHYWGNHKAFQLPHGLP
jgi:hypothetical protein